jgi:lipooligosaccharide transport system permease protein
VTAFALRRTRGHLLLERNLLVYRHAWMTIFSGFFEPLFYLFSLGLGLGHFVGPVQGVSYASYIAPALLASSAMNGALNDAMTNVFWKLRYMKVYDSVLSTPLGPGDVAVGETVWAQFRGFLYTCGFLATVAALGLIHSTWGILALPAAMVVAFSFAGIGIGASTFIRTWQDLDFVQLVQLPMFLFSTTFYPLSVYPTAVQWVVRLSPLYHAISLVRSFTLGTVGPLDVLHAGYLLAVGLLGIALARRRMAGLLLS